MGRIHCQYGEGRFAESERCVFFSSTSLTIIAPTDDFENADRLFDRAIEAAPNSVGPRLGKAMLAVDLKGDLSEIDKQLAHMQSRALVPTQRDTFDRGVSLDAATKISSEPWQF